MTHYGCPQGSKLTALLISLAMFSYGCSSTNPVRYTTDEQLSKDLAGRSATIELRGGREVFSNEIKIQNDSVSWLDSESDEETQVTMTDVNKIVIVKRNRLLGGLEGLAFVGFAGAGVGWLHAAGRPEGNRKEFGSLDIFSYGVIGAAIGLVTGVIIGHRDYCELLPPEHSDSLKSGK